MERPLLPGPPSGGRFPHPTLPPMNREHRRVPEWISLMVYLVVWLMIIVLAVVLGAILGWLMLWWAVRAETDGEAVAWLVRR